MTGWTIAGERYGVTPCSTCAVIFPGSFRKLSRTVTGFSVRRGFTGDQVSTIIGGCDATYLFVEHDPSLYEDDTRLIPVVVNKIRAFAHQNGTVIVYSEGTDRFMRQVMRAAHRVYIYAEWGDLIRRRIQRQRLQGHDRGFRSHQARLVAFARPAEEDQGCGKDAITRAGSREHVHGCLTGEDRSDQSSPADRDEARTSHGDFSGAASEY